MSVNQREKCPPRGLKTVSTNMSKKRFHSHLKAKTAVAEHRHFHFIQGLTASAAHWKQRTKITKDTRVKCACVQHFESNISHINQMIVIMSVKRRMERKGHGKWWKKKETGGIEEEDRWGVRREDRTPRGRQRFLKAKTELLSCWEHFDHSERLHCESWLTVRSCLSITLHF